MEEVHQNVNPIGTSDVFTVFLIVNTALGSGLLNFPKAFDEAGGITVAMLVHVVMLLFIIVALQVLVYCADQNKIKPACTLEEMVGQSVGAGGRIFCSSINAIYMFGTTVTFLIMLSDLFDTIFKSTVGADFYMTWYMNRDFTVSVCAVLVILPLCFSKKIDFLKYPSMFGVGAVLSLTVLIIYSWAFGSYPTPSISEIKLEPEKWTEIFSVIPAFCYGYQCHVSAIPIYSCMKHRNLKHFARVSTAAIAICAVANSVSGCCGYLTFGSKVNPDILLDFDANRPEVMFGVIAMAVKTVFTYPILLFCGREALQSAIKDVKMSLGYQVDPDSQSIVQRGVIVILWFSLSLICAIFIPDIGKVIKFLGCLAAFFIFFFPASSLIANTFKSDPLLNSRKGQLRVLLGSVFMAVGAFILGCAVTQNIQKIISTPTSG